MLHDFLEYWGFQKIPFSLNPDPDMLYPSRQHIESIVRMRYAIQTNKGGILLVSDHPGDGKTSLLKYMIKESLKYFENNITIAFIDHPSMTPNQMIREIAKQLGVVEPSRDRHRNLNQLKERLLHLHQTHHKCLIVIDEAHLLSKFPDTLQELRILLNYSISSEFLLTIVLCGQKPLESLIRSIPEFWQRLPVRYFLGNLNRDDTEGLIRYRLDKVGYKGDDIFTEDGIDALFQYSRGIPRVVCSLADVALLMAYSANLRHVDLVTMHDACMDLEGTSSQAFHYYKLLNKRC